MSLEAVSLDDKYDLDEHRILLSGTQAVVRLALTQQARDRRAGKNTAAYVTGYRGSPLGSLDQQFWRAADVLKPRNLLFHPAINEDLATTAMWGSQQAEMRGEGRFDGVFGLWYGKGPGVDRAGDALRHANLAGTSPLGGVVALMGDDHTCESSTTAHQSEFAFVDAMIPILNPAGVQEILDYGLLGYALSRYAGVWVGMKCVKDNIESTATVDGAPDRVATMVPQAFAMPSGGVNIRPRDNPLAQEERLHEQKIPAVLAFLMANAPDRIVHSGGRAPRFGIVTTGKSYLDVLQAFDELGIDEARAAELGIRVLKIACVWPLEPLMIRSFARGLEQIMVVEEKRGLIEPQIKEILYGTANAPRVIGKKNEADEWLFPSKGVLDPNDIAIALGERILARHSDDGLDRRVAQLRSAQAIAATRDLVVRTPYFCPGCPHNSSTVVPDGARAYAGIGCHYMVQSMDRATEGYTQMGGEGANWVGEAPFSTRGHVFQNIGDGTYNHSGSLAIRAAAASGINITYKILFNDAVALTGGQPMDSDLSVERIANQVVAEGAQQIVIVSDEPDKYAVGTPWPLGTTIRHRDDIDEVQRDLAKVGGLSVIIFDQTCAAEKRRRRKRGRYPDPDKIVVINELVCEGCGDCGVQSNCLAIVPVETEFGRKRTIDQSTCNKDFSCTKGFCPSFVTVHGARPHTRPEMIEAAFDLPEPEVPLLDRNYGVLITGIGGTGVVTIGALLTMAAHIEGKSAGAIDMAGLAQKGGAVTTHLRLAPSAADIKAIRVAAAGADVLLGCDMVVAGSAKSLAAIAPGTTSVFVNTNETPPGEFTRDADYTLPSHSLLQALEERAGSDHIHVIDATRTATALFGDSIATNMFLLGFAWQAGVIPLSRQAIEQATELNGVDVAMNKAAFAWGRRAAVEPEAVAAIANGRRDGGIQADVLPTLDGLVARRAEFLGAYQDQGYADSYTALVTRVRDAEARVAPGESRLGEAVAVNLFKLMAVKDEYEVARLYTDGSFRRQLERDLSSWQRLEFHLAPPVLGERDSVTGHLRKRVFGPWMMWVFRLLAKAKRVRGTRYDVFGYSRERRTERRLLAEYEATLDTLLAVLTRDRHERAIVLALWPEPIRGFGHVKDANIALARAEATARLAIYLSEMANITEAAE